MFLPIDGSMQLLIRTQLTESPFSDGPPSVRSQVQAPDRCAAGNAAPALPKELGIQRANNGDLSNKNGISHDLGYLSIYIYIYVYTWDITLILNMISLYITLIGIPKLELGPCWRALPRTCPCYNHHFW